MKVNRDRLWDKLHEVGGIGAVPEGGISRFAWTPEYQEACQLLMGWMEELGLKVRMMWIPAAIKRLGKRCGAQ